MQTYRVDVGVAQVIIGNEVLLKCDIPSFAADFVSVNAWIDSEGHSFARDKHLGIILAGVANIDKKVQAILWFVFAFFNNVYSSGHIISRDDLKCPFPHLFLRNLSHF